MLWFDRCCCICLLQGRGSWAFIGAMEVSPHEDHRARWTTQYPVIPYFKPLKGEGSRVGNIPNVMDLDVHDVGYRFTARVVEG